MRAGAAIDKLTSWFVNEALPLWSKAGVDNRGGFYESLDFDGAPMPGRRRVRVQCRQVHTFTEAGSRGWLADGEAIAARGFDRLLATAVPKDGARGCVHTLHDDGAIDQHLRDLYDQAFLLLACAARIKVARDPRAAMVASNTMAFLDREFASPHGGYRENDRGGHPRRQNPHMHLFEALMALHSATGEALYLDRARAIEALFRTKFFDSGKSVLREYFNDDWSLIEKVSDRIEPGHMAEWVALLDKFEGLTGERRTDLKAALYKDALSRRAPGTPFLPSEAMLGERPDRAARRLWPQTELLRAALALGDIAHAETLIAALFKSYLDQPVEGLWCDEYDAKGEPLATSVPASILYHLLEAVVFASDARKDIAA
ncbi:MAG: AGE family epimerase/isomerase [Parvularculaceae bacterium]